MRCEKHDLAAGADGLCVVCRRDARASTPAPASSASPTVRVFGVLGAAFALVLGGGAIYRSRSASADQTIAPASDVLRPPSAPSTVAATSTAARNLDGDLDGERRRQQQLDDEARRKQDQGQADLQRALANVRIVVYTTQWCPSCKKAKAWLRENAVPFEERDVEASAEYSRQMAAINSRGSIPTFDIEGEVSVGFSSAWVMSTRERAARRKMPPRL